MDSENIDLCVYYPIGIEYDLVTLKRKVKIMIQAPSMTDIVEQAALISALREHLVYPSPQEAFDAYVLAGEQRDELIQASGISVSASMAEFGGPTCGDLVSAIDSHQSSARQAILLFLSMVHGRVPQVSGQVTAPVRDLGECGSLLQRAEELAQSAELLALTLRGTY